jgi:hypothetical protein
MKMKKNKTITELFKTQAPPDFGEFFQHQNEKHQAVIELLQSVTPTSSPELEQLDQAKISLQDLLKKYQPFLGSMLVFDKGRMSASKLQEELESALESNQIDGILIIVLRSLVYMGVSLDEYLNFKPKP